MSDTTLIERPATAGRTPSSPNAVQAAQAAARAALAHREALARQVAAIRDERDGLVSRLRGLGLDVTDSDANFVLFGAFADRHAVWRALLERGVLVREIGPEGHLRVSVGTPGENAAFLAALQEAM